MIWIILTILVNLTIPAVMLVRGAELFDEVLPAGLFVLLVSFAVLIALPSMIIGSAVATTHTTATSQLANLKDQTGTSGAFFLGIGSIGNKFYYSYYKEVGPDQYTHKLLADDGTQPITIVEDSPRTPYVETYQDVVEPKLTFWYWIAYESINVTKIEFHVPKGSIARNINLGN